MSDNKNLLSEETELSFKWRKICFKMSKKTEIIRNRRNRSKKKGIKAIDNDHFHSDKKNRK